MHSIALEVSDEYHVTADYSVEVTKRFSLWATDPNFQTIFPNHIAFEVERRLEDRDIRFNQEAYNGDLTCEIVPSQHGCRIIIRAAQANVIVAKRREFSIQYELPKIFDGKNPNSTKVFSFSCTMPCQYRFNISLSAVGLMPGHFTLDIPYALGLNSNHDVIPRFGDEMVRNFSALLALEPGSIFRLKYFHAFGHLEELPIVSRIIDVETLDGSLFDRYTLVFVLHFLTDLPPFLRGFLRLGAKPEAMYASGIPYSTQDGIFAQVEHLGINLARMAEYGTEFEGQISRLFGQAIRYSNRTGKKIIVVEDGGYVASLLRSDFQLEAGKVVGIVEQTANGIFAARGFENSGNHHTFPILNVAETELKGVQESPQIGHAVIHNIKTLLVGMVPRCPVDTRLNGVRVALIGCGSIGVHIVQELLNAGANVTVVEQNAQRIERLNAEVDPKGQNLTIVPVEEAATASDYLSEIDIVIGATGETHFTEDAKFQALKDQVILVNASSKRREFDWETIGKFSQRYLALPGFGSRRDLIDPETMEVKSVFFAADGYPVNFFGGTSLNVKVIEPVMAMLFRGAVAFARSEAGMLEPGINDFPVQWQALISTIRDEIDSTRRG